MENLMNSESLISEAFRLQKRLLLETRNFMCRISLLHVLVTCFKIRRHSSRKLTAHLPAVHVSVATTKCQCHLGGRGDRSSKCTSLNMTTVMTTRCQWWWVPCLVSRGYPCPNVSWVMVTWGPPWTEWQTDTCETLPSRNFVGGR